MLIRIRLLVILVFLSNIIYAQTDPSDSLSVSDTLPENEPAIPDHIDSVFMKSFRFSQNIDSLLKLWYVKVNEDVYDTLFDAIPDSLLTEVPDCVIIDRLNAIPSVIDMSYNNRVKAFINLYTVKRRKQVATMLGVSECYFPVFEEILDQYDMPYELKYLPVIESALNPRARSRAGAMGMWQFMYTTGKLYKLEINSFVDERLDPVMASHAAAKYLKDLYGIYNDWTLALAAYNCGPGNVNRAIRRSGGKTNYWVLYPYLPRETRGYVPAFIAATYAMTYYKEYGIKPVLIEQDLTDTVMVNQELHLQQVADVLGLPLKAIQDLNPQYRRDIIPAKTNKYSLMLPFEYTTKFIDLQDSIYNYKDSVFFARKEASIPQNYKSSQYVPPPPSPDMVKLKYKVKPGDNVGFIAEWYDIRLSDLRYWNNIRRNFIKAGQKLIIYKHKNVASKYKNIDSMSFEAKQKMIGKDVTVKKEEKNIPEDAEFVYYTVRRGDNFWSIAKRFDGVSNIDIMRLNNINDEGSLKPGQRLKIKPKS
ncbi:MAG: lytic transglycosylase [Marinilabiliales bacterium]|nr:MAG: lytic transglycosylase [Marinilabiliales bacterium]